jgi:hypothetical protein
MLSPKRQGDAASSTFRPGIELRSHGNTVGSLRAKKVEEKVGRIVASKSRDSNNPKILADGQLGISAMKVLVESMSIC